MSLQGARSQEGYEYQLKIALHWLICLLEDKTIEYIQAESTGLLEEEAQISVDDVVVRYVDGSMLFIQAKKNQTDNREWSFTDLKDELVKAFAQVQGIPSATIRFYSRTPFGEVQSLVETCRRLPHLHAFHPQAGAKAIGFLAKLCSALGCGEEEAFTFTRQIQFGPYHSNEDWDQVNKDRVRMLVGDPDNATLVLRELLGRHSRKEEVKQFTISRQDVVDELAKKGHFLTPPLDVAHTLEEFVTASGVGRNWIRDIGGERIERKAVRTIMEHIDSGKCSILLLDKPGMGKTCVLLELADRIEARQDIALLFIRGDEFADCTSEADLATRGLPRDIAGTCSRLALEKKVVVVIDSLDVLSLARRHGSLKVFLRLMDRLARINNICLVAACREFDLNYDLDLKSRQWDEHVPIGPLDLETEVVPLLKKWNVDPQDLEQHFLELLTVPQHLRIYQKLLEQGKSPQGGSEATLLEAYFNEIVFKYPKLGPAMATGVKRMAACLSVVRTMSISRASFKEGEEVLQALLSLGVFQEDSRSRLRFSHQTLADYLAARNILEQGQTLVQFVESQHQHPFIRPVVRTLFFRLREEDVGKFRTQVRELLSDADTAYHFKRLICESFGEVVPEEDDWRLVRFLFGYEEDLFQSYFFSVRDLGWLGFFETHWLPIARSPEHAEKWVGHFFSLLRRWMNERPSDVIRLWKTGIDEEWIDPKRLAWEIVFPFDVFTAWHTEGVRELLEELVKIPLGDRDFFGKALSRYVDATNDGDQLLWEWITKSVSEEEVKKIHISTKIRCQSHHFYKDDFFLNRLLRSDVFLSITIASLNEWSRANFFEWKGQLQSNLLDATEWRNNHHGGDINNHLDSLEILLGAVGQALRKRARENTPWWQKNEPFLRSSLEVGFRYLAIQSYMENISANMEGIEAQLTDSILFRYSHLEYELGQLMRAAYPELSEEVQLANQVVIRSLYCEEGDDKYDWVDIVKCSYFVWIPTIFRTKETQGFVDRCSTWYGIPVPTPSVYTRGGLIASPVGLDVFMSLADKNIIRVLKHYNNYNDWDEVADGDLVGGMESLFHVLSDASCKDPNRFFQLVEQILDSNLNIGYEHSIIRGVSRHIACRFGNLRLDNWSPVEPLPEGSTLGKRLLEWVEGKSVIKESENTIYVALKSCGDVLQNSENIGRIISQISRCLATSSQEITEDESIPSPGGIRVLSSQDELASAIVKIFVALVESEEDIPAELLVLVFGVAGNPTPSVRIDLLRRLPFIIYRRPELGWDLLDKALDGAPPELWGFAESSLYYNYSKNFERVRPYLDQMYNESVAKAEKAWGRIATLSYLDDKLHYQELFPRLKERKGKACEGAVEIFTHNIDRKRISSVCQEGLREAIKSDWLSPEKYDLIDQMFEKDGDASLIGSELACLFVEKLPKKTDRFIHTPGFLEWIGKKAGNAPLDALNILERFAARLEEIGPCHLHPTEPIVSALYEILKEADEVGDVMLIRRSIALQDSFLRLRIEGVDQLLERVGSS